MDPPLWAGLGTGQPGEPAAVPGQKESSEKQSSDNVKPSLLHRTASFFFMLRIDSFSRKQILIPTLRIVRRAMAALAS